MWCVLVELLLWTSLHIDGTFSQSCSSRSLRPQASYLRLGNNRRQRREMNKHPPASARLAGAVYCISTIVWDIFDLCRVWCCRSQWTLMNPYIFAWTHFICVFTLNDLLYVSMAFTVRTLSLDASASVTIPLLLAHRSFFLILSEARSENSSYHQVQREHTHSASACWLWSLKMSLWIRPVQWTRWRWRIH